MFNNPFSFEGRISRTEYGLTQIFSIFILSLIRQIVFDIGNNDGMVILVISILLLSWFNLAQGAKREHDLGNSGWWQLIPFRNFLLIFIEGEQSFNKYGENPKKKDNINNNDNSHDENILQNPKIADIENKEKLLLKSLQNNLINESEFLEKNNSLLNEKNQLLNELIETEIKTKAEFNVKNKIKDLYELKKEGLLSELEYNNKCENLIKSEIEKIKNKKNSNDSFVNKVES